jgi:hypothetical protein
MSSQAHKTNDIGNKASSTCLEVGGIDNVYFCGINLLCFSVEKGSSFQSFSACFEVCDVTKIFLFPIIVLF